LKRAGMRVMRITTRKRIENQFYNINKCLLLSNYDAAFYVIYFMLFILCYLYYRPQQARNRARVSSLGPEMRRMKYVVVR